MPKNKVVSIDEANRRREAQEEIDNAAAWRRSRELMLIGDLLRNWHFGLRAMQVQTLGDLLTDTASAALDSLRTPEEELDYWHVELAD